jgi:hypothetical protein
VKVMRIEDDERVVAIEPINEGQNDAPLEGETEEGSEEGTPGEDGTAPPSIEGDDGQGSDDGGQEGA